jgi:hypothetical protein
MMVAAEKRLRVALAADLVCMDGWKPGGGTLTSGDDMESYSEVVDK